ncbi:MAG TPA: Fic family protein [Gammaproteobacteria bacterium]|nr:Fic family protein [Gammaproteobacteria bacterium]
MQTPDLTLRPLYPGPSTAFREDADALVREASRLQGALHPVTRQGIADLLGLMNSYYSNLIEGHRTYPREIEQALRDSFSNDPAERDLQREAVAHVETEKEVRAELARDPALNPAATDFLRWIHERFYSRIPEETRYVEGGSGQREPVIPGEFRPRGVAVGRHLPPDAGDLPALMRAFENGYRVDRLHHPEDLAAVVAAHHRLVWIHPFLDGNGRVARILLQAHLHRLELLGEGLWSMARGLARNSPRYRELLAAADARKHDMMDGRGHLTERGLLQLCEFMAATARDQVRFMAGVLELDTLTQRMRTFVDLDPELRPEAFYLLREAAIRGEMARGEAARITGLGERTARELVKDLLGRGLLESDSAKKPVRLGFPTVAAETYFPRLFLPSA